MNINQNTIVQSIAILMVSFLMISCQSSSSCGTCRQTISANDSGPAGVPLFAKVSDSLYRGAQPSEEGFVELEKMGIRSIITLRIFDTDKKYLLDMNFHQFHISCKTLHPEEEDVIEFLKIVTNPANQPVFVHCREGTDRTGMMVAAYRIVVQHWSRQKALAEMKESGFNEIWDPLEDYIENLNVFELKSQLAKAD